MIFETLVSYSSKIQRKTTIKPYSDHHSLPLNSTTLSTRHNRRNVPSPRPKVVARMR